MERSLENEISTQLLTLTIDHERNESADSFNSDPGTNFNRGAAQFLTLLESALARRQEAEQALSFEQLVVQMMDIDISPRIPTSQHIAESLNKNGWDLGQVAAVWTVGTEPMTGHWTDSAIDALGGKGSLNRIWNELKANSRTGFPKRRCEDGLTDHPRKKQRMQELPSLKVSHSRLSDDNKDAQVLCTPTNSSVVDECFSPSVLRNPPSNLACRRQLIPNRRTIANRNKITWWLSSQKSDPLPSHPATPTANNPSCSHPMTPETRPSPNTATPEPGRPTSDAKPKRKRQRRKPKNSTPIPPQDVSGGSIKIEDQFAATPPPSRHQRRLPKPNVPMPAHSLFPQDPGAELSHQAKKTSSFVPVPSPALPSSTASLQTGNGSMEEDIKSSKKF